MKFCSQCGKPVTQRIPDGDARLRYVCDHCSTIHYQNPNIVAGTVILGWLIESTDSEDEALAGYYQDLRSVRADGLLPETKAFVRGVQMQRGRLEVAR